MNSIPKMNKNKRWNMLEEESKKSIGIQNEICKEEGSENLTHSNTSKTTLGRHDSNSYKENISNVIIKLFRMNIMN